MAKRDPRSNRSKAGWRQKGKAAGRGGRRGDGKPGVWARRPDRTYERAVERHRLRLAVGTLLAVGLIVGFILYVIWLPVRTPLVVAAVTHYDAPLPPNALAEEDAARLVALEKEEITLSHQVPWEATEDALRRLRHEIQGAKPGGPERNVVIVYLSAHGAVNTAGEPCLIPPGASAYRDGQWLRLRDLLDELFVKGLPEKSTDSVQKLLILDTCRMDANWGLGLLYNSFADKLPSVVEEAAIPNLVVLSAAGPGQIGHAAPELDGSAFGYFLWQGLRGAADTEQGGNGDRRVSLQELYAYVKAHVGQWVTENRTDRQQPVLFPSDADFPVVYARRSAKTTLPESHLRDDPRWDQIAALWRRHAALGQEERYRVDPLGWAALEQKLLRLESLILAGHAQVYEDEFREAHRDAENLAGALAKDPLPEDLATLSLPLARRLGRADEIDRQRAELLAYLNWTPGDVPGPDATDTPQPEPKPDDTGTEQPGDAAGEKPGAAEEPPAESPPKRPELKKPYSYWAAAQAAWEWGRDHPDRDGLAEGFELVDGAEPRPPADTVEIRLLRMLDRHLEWRAAAAGVPWAMAARKAAEEAAVPADPRAHYWVRALVDEADDARRKAEDRLYVGSPEALGEAQQLWAEAAGADGRSGTYARAARFGETLTRAFGTRDAALADLPFLTGWLLARDRPTSDAELQALDRAIGALRTLGDDLDLHAGTGRWEGESVEAAREVDETLAGLRKGYDEECSRLRVTAGEDKQTLRAIASVLAVPLVTGDQRNQLRAKFLRIADAKGSASAERRGVAPGETPASDAGAATAWLDRLRGRPVHPVLAMLGGSAEMPREAEKPEEEHSPELAREQARARLAAQGGAVRRLLEDFQAAAKKLADETTEMLERDPGRGRTPADVRLGLSRADRLVRAAAPLAGHRPWSGSRADPPTRLFRLDCRFLLVWHGRRAVDDFWGPSSDRGASYFETVARAYLESAKELCPNARAPSHGEPPLPTLLENRIRAAEEGNRPQAPDLVLVEDEPSLPLEASVETAPGQPDGEAAVYLQTLGGRTLESPAGEPMERKAMRIVPAGSTEPVPYRVPADPRLASAAILQAVAFYRGHLGVGNVTIVPPTGTWDIVHVRQEPANPKITVYGESKQQTDVMFIFDCSGSMSRRLGGREGAARRIDVARGTLQDLLRRMAYPDNPFHVGLRIYGHRVGWNPDDPSKIFRRQPGLNLHPSEDVELVLPLGRFSDTELEEVNEKLGGLQPTGETPLYLAIVQALGDFHGTAPKRRIVAVTDGVNQQTPPPGGRNSSITIAEDVERALRQGSNRGVQLDIVGFDITAATDDAKKSLAELKRLAELTGGKFHRATDPSSLVKALESSLELSQFEVVPADNPDRPSEPLELGMAWRSSTVPDGPRDYFVRVLNPQHPAETEVTLRGNEALELYLENDPVTGGRRLVYHPFTHDDIRDERPALVDPLDRRRKVRLGALLPRDRGGSMEFRLFVQNADAAEFSPRPAEAWVEVTTVPPRGSEDRRTYVFYDLQFERERPVPVLSFTAPNWPPEARKAEVRAWCKFQPTPPDKRLTIAELVQHGAHVEGLPDVSFEAEVQRARTADEKHRVIITERHQRRGSIGSVKVQIVPEAGTIRRHYIPDAGLVHHTFYFDASPLVDLADHEVQLTTRQSATERAVTVSDPPLLVTTVR